MELMPGMTPASTQARSSAMATVISRAASGAASPSTSPSYRQLVEPSSRSDRQRTRRTQPNRLSPATGSWFSRDFFATIRSIECPCVPVRTPGGRRCHFKYGRRGYIPLERCDSYPGIPAASMTYRWCRTITRRPILTNLCRPAARNRPARTVCGRVALWPDRAQRASVTKPQAATVSRTGASRSSRRWLAANAVLNAASWPVCRLIQLTTVWS